MNFGEQSSSSKDVLQQKKLEYFGITSNFIQGKGKGKSTESYIGKNVLIIIILF